MEIDIVKKKFKEISEGWFNYIFKNEAIEELAKTRALICASCEFNKRNTCQKCGCSLSKKTRSETSSCPKEKW